MYTRLHVLAPSAPKLPKKPLIPQFLKFALPKLNSNKSSWSLESLLSKKGLGVAEMGLASFYTRLVKVYSEIP